LTFDPFEAQVCAVFGSYPAVAANFFSFRFTPFARRSLLTCVVPSHWAVTRMTLNLFFTKFFCPFAPLRAFVSRFVLPVAGTQCYLPSSCGSAACVVPLSILSPSILPLSPSIECLLSNLPFFGPPNPQLLSPLAGFMTFSAPPSGT